MNYKGNYHLHHNGVAMTGFEHTESSEILTLTDKRDTIKTINRAIKTIRRISTTRETSSGRGGY